MARFAPKAGAVAEAVRAMIAESRLLPGEAAPSAAALSGQTGTSYVYCLQALRLLVAEGTLERESPGGRPRVPRAGYRGQTLSGGNNGAAVLLVTAAAFVRTCGRRGDPVAGCDPTGRNDEGELRAVDDAGAERIARLHLALAGRDAARFADRGEIEAAARIEARWPGTGAQFAAAPAFHGRAARRAVTDDGAAGVIFGAAGFPGAVAPHGEAAAAAPGARFVIADASGEASYLNGQLLAGPGASAVRASVRDPEGLMGLPEVAALGSPLQLHLQLCAHFWAEETCRDLLGRYAGLLPPRSTLALSLWCSDGTAAGREFLAALGAAAGCPAYGHSCGEVAGWLEGAGMKLLAPGVGGARRYRRGWRYPPPSARSPGLVAGAVARVP